MNLEEFKQTNTPRGKRSLLLPYIKGIFDLKQSGYTNLQIANWLKESGLEITQESVRQFIVRQEKLAAKNKSLGIDATGETKKTEMDKQPDQEVQQATKHPMSSVSKMKTLLTQKTDFSEFE
ncbi:MAG: hypothetical protein ACXWJK_15155 [Burkholderiaceae bacterium]